MTDRQRQSVQEQLDALGHAVAMVPGPARGELLVPWGFSSGVVELYKLKFPPNVSLKYCCGERVEETVIRRRFEEQP